MRKQYYFRPSPGGFDAWDVHRLIELSAGLEVREVEVASIAELDTAYWFGAGGEQMTVRTVARHVELVGEADLSYPIILAADGAVMDGMHRVVRALVEGRATIAAVRFAEQPPADYHDVSPDELPYD